MVARHPSMTDAVVLTLWDADFNQFTQVTDHFRFQVRNSVMSNPDKIEIAIGAKWQDPVRVCHVSIGFFMIPLAIPKVVKAGEWLAFDPGMIQIDLKGFAK